MSLTIYKASAGSGKTFKLTENYLRLLFQNTNYYRHILAVTFTNKATEEMKRRVLDELNKLSRRLPSGYADLFPDLDRDQLAEKALEARTKILHDYSHFHISTIDSFFQRIIRSFLKEIGLDFSFEVETDSKKLLSEVIGLLLMQAGGGTPLDQWLVDFAEDQMNEGKGWKIEKSIEKLGNQLFSEKYKLILPYLEKGLADKKLLTTFKNDLYAEKKQFETRMKALASEALDIIKKAGLQYDDFKSKGKSFANYFNKILDGEYAPTITAGKSADNIGEWITARSEKEAQIRKVYEPLNEKLKQILAFYEGNYTAYNSYDVILKNFSTLGIMVDLAEKLKEHKNEKSFFLLSDSGDLLTHIIDGADAPFVYEKTGTAISHFMIDEFQDTSRMQWSNFKPLILNSLSQHNDCMLVGDVKQSIYRWRNSDWNIMASEAEKDFPGQEIKQEPLNFNWRSAGNIIRFNNAFFPSAVKWLGDIYNESTGEKPDLISMAYKDVIQKKKKDDQKGYVHIEFCKDDDKGWKEKALDALPGIFNAILDKGYSLHDTAVIVRNGKDGKLVADYLLEYRKNNPSCCYDVISDESIYLTSSYAVQFITGILNHLVQPGDVQKAALIHLFYRYVIKDNEIAPNEYFTIAEIFNQNIQKRLDEADLLRNDYSLIELVEQVIRLFDLSSHTSQLPFIQSFQDKVQEFSRRQSSDPASLMTWWEEEKDGFAISINSDTNAARILTIHKSKGLEFKNVIVPFCDWDIDHNPLFTEILWAPAEAEDAVLKKYNDVFRFLPVPYGKKLADTYFRQTYFSEKNQTFVDNLNLMYVAFTRAKENLFVSARDTGEDERKGTVGDILYRCVSKIIPESGNEELKKCWDAEQRKFIYGQMQQDEVSEEAISKPVQLESYPVTSVRQKLRQKYSNRELFYSEGDISQSPVNKGLLMHLVFSKIKTPADIFAVTGDLIRDGKLEEKDSDNFINEMQSKINSDKRVQSWFSSQWDELKTEKDILIPKGFQYRPDRVMIKGKSALVVDYKFGDAADDKHISQVKRYMLFLDQMGYSPVRGALWYYMRGEVVEVGLGWMLDTR